MGVRDNLLVGAYTAHRDAERNLEMVFDLFPVLRERQHQETGTQSGGERQMVTLGRALMSSPRLLIVDEPTIGLAPRVCLDIAAALRRMNAELGITILIAEQNVKFATRLARDVHVLETGEIRMSGTADEQMNDHHVREAYFGYRGPGGPRCAGGGRRTGVEEHDVRRLLRPWNLQPIGHDRIRGGAALVRPGACLDLRLQP